MSMTKKSDDDEIVQVRRRDLRLISDALWQIKNALAAHDHSDKEWEIIAGEERKAGDPADIALTEAEKLIVEFDEGL